jgi:hypothetical protein
MKRRRHSVRSTDRALLQRIDLQKHSHQRNSHGKSALDAYEAHEGPRVRTKNDPRDSQDSRITDVIPPDEYVQNWLATTLRGTNGQSAIGLEPGVQNCRSLLIPFSRFPPWLGLFTRSLTFSSKFPSFQRRKLSAAPRIQALPLREWLRFKTALHKSTIQEARQQGYRVQLR